MTAVPARLSLLGVTSHLHLVPAAEDSPVDSPASSPIRIVLADDHALMRRSLRRLLDDEQDVEVAGEADELDAVEREVRLRKPHVLVLDLGMHDGFTDIESIGRLRERAPAMRIVGLTMHDDSAFAQHALKAGVAGFVSKELADAELMPAIRAAARGEQFVSPRIAERLEARRNARAQGALYMAARESGHSV